MATTISLRELSENAMQAVAADSEGPVIVTEAGRPTHVVLSYEGYRALLEGAAHRAESEDMPTATAQSRNIVHMLAMPGEDTLPDEYEFQKAEFHFKITHLAD